MKRTSLPKPIKSKNPVVILKAVIRAITEEPKRYDQMEVVERAVDSDYNPAYQRERFPACGTVACVGGWINLLTDAKGKQVYDLQRAGQKLGLTTEERYELFGGSPAGVRNRWEVTPRQHASDGVKHIKRFVLKKWGKKI